MEIPYKRENGKRLSVVSSKEYTPEQRAILSDYFKDRIKRDLLVTDETFDLVYSAKMRHFSPVHWTPVGVALRAAKIMQQLKVQSALDVGSGCGKFCIAAGLYLDINFTGIEQRAYLVKEANAVKSTFALENIHFLNQSAFDVSWEEYDCFYFYNPFYEQKEPGRRICNDVPLDESFFSKYVNLSKAKLAGLRKNTVIITYHGLGGLPPAGYRLYADESIGSDYLKVWIKE